MNFIKRGVTSVIRKPGKALILLALVFVLGIIIAGAISIRQAVENTESNLRAKMSPVTTVSYDQSVLMAALKRTPEFVPEPLSVEVIEKIGALSYVKSFDYSTMVSLESDSLQSYDASGGQMMGFAYFGLKGVNNPDLIDLQEGRIELVAGRVFGEDEMRNLTFAAMVSQNFANENNLSVGSKMSLESKIYELSDEPIVWGPDGMMGERPVAASQMYEFEIIGLFEPVKQVREDNGTMDFQWIDTEVENRIYVSNRVANEIAAFQFNEEVKLDPERAKYSYSYYEPLYVLRDPLDLEKFKAEVKALTPDYFTVIDTAGSFDQVAAPMRSFQSIAVIILYTAVVAALIILSLVITLFLRDRKREIGIYLSLGERKSKVAGQIVLEVIIVAVLAITLSLFTGNILAGVISEWILIDQIAAEQASIDDMYGRSVMFTELDRMGYRSDISSDDLLQNYAVSLNWATVFLFFAVGLGTVCLSTLAPIVYTTRLNPKKIMM
jgi:putative ABC transport system permease protein